MGGKPRDKSRIKAPVERLEHCHDKLRLQLDRLVELAERVQSKPADDKAWLEVDDICAYMQRAVVRHEEDEEASVFPRLARHPALRPLLQRLRGDHKAQGKQVGKLVRTVDKRSTLGLGDLCVALRRNYIDHMKREDRELLPVMTRLLSEDEQADVALEMADRRG